MVIELHHPTDPRYLVVEHPPERVTIDDLSECKYGKLFLLPWSVPAMIYDQPGGFGTDWVRPC
jgi:hypothetical protein